MTHLYVLAILCLIVAASEWLVRRTRLRPVGTALLVIVMTATLANIGVLPAGSATADTVPVYRAILGEGALLAVFWLLLTVRLRDTLAAIGPVVVLFLAGVAGVAAGVILALWGIQQVETMAPLPEALGGLIVAAFTGGSASAEAVAFRSGATVDRALVDGLHNLYPALVAFWLAITLIVPRLLLPIWPRKAFASSPAGGRAVDAGATSEARTVHVMHLGLMLALGLGAVWLAGDVAARLSGWGVAVPAVLLVTVLALAFGQVRTIVRLQGAHLLGTFAVYLFLAVLGARFEVAALAGLDGVGRTLLVAVLVVVLVHGVVSYVAARWMRVDPTLAAVASQAGVGDAASALALARGLGRPDLFLPAVLAGVLGIIGGASLGGWAAAYVLPMLGG